MEEEQRVRGRKEWRRGKERGSGRRGVRNGGEEGR